MVQRRLVWWSGWFLRRLGIWDFDCTGGQQQFIQNLIVLFPNYESSDYAISIHLMYSSLVLVADHIGNAHFANAKAGC